ncbi:hypothetical protein PR202_gb13397 [Eleusine coracana subsp. coracana]|uniref:Uncharacterized protein n=1 Tax=Eleusine coracana subsp. coracana TaxID=191504 RepID=A0AAV5EQF2_ELECO|nr:hypothetical protein QOZ80_9BG0714460 [Eleusine coracana subsp. coracana]GJN25554.1 hypothetical protein PR202_gb13397 [Eleusine coracana subsp. coracana]
MRSSIDEVTVKLDVSLRDCELLLKIGELYDEGPLDDTSTCVELQRLLAWLEISHTEAKILALDGLLEALNKDEKRVVSMLGRDNVSAVVQLLTAPWPEVIRDKAATVVCHVVVVKGSSNAWQLLESEVTIPPLIRLMAKSDSQKAVVTLHHLSSTSLNTAWVIVSHGGIGPLIDMCCLKKGDSVSQSAAAGTLKNISAAPHVRQLLADHGTIGAMVSLLHCADALRESKEHAAECLINFTSSGNDDCLRRAVVAEGGLYALLLYLGDTDWHEAGVRAIRNLVGVISTTTSGDTTMMMKRLGGERRCVPLLVRTMWEVDSPQVSNSAREVAVQMLASLATYPPNAMKMGEDLGCVAGLVHRLDPDRYNNTIYKHAIQCLLSLASTSKRCREIMTVLRGSRHLRKLSDMNVEGATELLHRLEGGRLRSLFGIRKM